MLQVRTETQCQNDVEKTQDSEIKKTHKLYISNIKLVTGTGVK